MLVEQRIKTGEWNFDESAFKHVSAEARVVVAALLAPVPGQRPSPEELLEVRLVTDQQHMRRESPYVSLPYLGLPTWRPHSFACMP